MTSDFVYVPRDTLAKLVAVARHVSLSDATARFALGELYEADLLEQFAKRCTWPDCLTPAQQQRLAEDIARTDRGEEPAIEPDQRLACRCVDLGVDDGLDAEFEAHAEESLALANEGVRSPLLLNEEPE